uniref:Uncharacterized protein n=1 Tax=Rhizophora mucronata TaxID=61149 RepID=A0A2P2NXG4_RHIMU
MRLPYYRLREGSDVRSLTFVFTERLFQSLKL